MEAHYRARDIFKANVEEIGPGHLSKPANTIVAVERHNAYLPEYSQGKDQYLWLKAKRKTLFGKVRESYIQTSVSGDPAPMIDVTFNGHPVTDETKMGDLDTFHDQVVVFLAKERTLTNIPQTLPENAAPAQQEFGAAARRTAPPTSSMTPRPPLQLVNRQLSVPLQQSADEMGGIKPPGMFQAGFGQPPYPILSDAARNTLTHAGPLPNHRGVPTPQSAASQYHTPMPIPGTQFEPLQVRQWQPPPQLVPQYDGTADMMKPEPGLEPEPAQVSDFEAKREESPKYEPKMHENPFNHDEDPSVAPSRGQPLRQLAEESQPERLEASVRTGVEVLAELEAPLKQLQDNADAAAFLQQIETVRKAAQRSRTVVGVVGNTGAGKSSVINAMLEEERLVPTNCMRACTAVVTEMSYNFSKLDSSKYRAEIEFITPEEWRRELDVLFAEVFDENGRLLHDARDPDKEAGVAYAKIRAVYHKYTQDSLGKASIDKLMREPSVSSILGSTRRINEREPEPFYKRLQSYVDSKEKGEEKRDKNGNKIGLRKRRLELWPLIKVVRIFTKADALSTGAVIVDLPGVHDSNAARAAVAASYMKSCTGLWIVAPITRAVDDKAAAKLLGDTFKRQLKFDGTYSAVTFICSKTDDISKTEATDSLELGEEMTKIEDQLQTLMRQRKEVSAQLKEARGKKADHESVFNEVDEQIDAWEALKDRFDEGKTVYAPAEKTKKRKRAARESNGASRKRRRRSGDSDDEAEYISSDDDDNGENDGCEPPAASGPSLTEQQIEEKLEELKTLKKDAKREKAAIQDQVRDLQKQLNKIQNEEADLDDQGQALCIAGRNTYSRTAIKQDFATGIRELDMENAEEENPDDFNPDEDLRDYDEVARSLPVFCVSSRAYQKLSGRLQKDSDVPGFLDKEQTEVPQLQAHCKKLTEHGRAANCRRFLNSLNRLVSSLALWASDDGSGPKLNQEQHDHEQKHLKRRLQDLEKHLDKTANNTVEDILETMTEYVFNMFVPAVQAAAKAAPATQANWGAHRDSGGLPWATYKATTRRSGVFQGSRGFRDFNTELTEPMMKNLQNHWEKVFVRKLPHILQAFAKSGNKLLKDFHSAVEGRCREKGHGVARIGMLGHQLKNYEHVFNDASQATIAHINERQRDINREFVPVVTERMQGAYDACVNESGPGSFKRMKASMETFVDQQREAMFDKACAHVQKRLDGMCEEVRKQLLDRVEAVFMNMRRDYMSLIGGVDMGQVQQIPRGERKAKQELDEVISLMDDEFNKVVDADLETLRIRKEGEAGEEEAEGEVDDGNDEYQSDNAEETGQDDDEQDDEAAAQDEASTSKATDAEEDP